MAKRMAQLIATTVVVLCPHCGEVQAAPNGSEFWTGEDFIHKHGAHTCDSCDEKMLIEPQRRPIFQW